MTENNTMDSIHKGLLKKYHTLCSLLGMTEWEKKSILEGYNVESSRDLDTHDLVDICADLSARVERLKKGDEIVKLRKRAMAAIGSYLRSVQRKESAEIIKAIACRATGHDEFGKIPKERLRNLIATFNNKVKDAASVDEITAELTNPKIIKLHISKAKWN